MSKTPTKGAQVADGTKVLIDKVAIYGFRVAEILNEHRIELIKKGILTIKKGPVRHIWTDSGCEYNSIVIVEDGVIDSMRYGISPDGGIYGHMELSIPDEGSHNLICYTCCKWQERISDIREYLIKSYGIVLDLKEAKYSSIEVNKTIILNSDFAEYRRVLNRIMCLMPPRLHLGALTTYTFVDTKSCKHKTQTFTRSSGKRGITIEIYDKTAQLASLKVYAAYNYCRFEIRICNPTKIEEKLGTNRVFELTDEAVTKFFLRFVADYIVAPDRKNKEERVPALKRLLKKHYRPSSHTWVRDVLDDLAGKEIKEGHAMILSIEELLPALAALKFRSPAQRRYARHAFRDASKSMDVYNTNDDKKHEEVIIKLLNS